MLASGVIKKVLLNGLTVLVHAVHNIPKISMELAYHVGSKDEGLSKNGLSEKGMAHLIEHMIFKGTHKLSESDINIIGHKLSGYVNAFTSFDVTAYVYEFPSQYLDESFMLLSDCMRNCRFDEQMLNSELKAVIQELKMGRDNYVGEMLYDLISAIFHDHPYHSPIIGFKQDLWSLDRQALVDFYEKHYVPNNAVLTIVGDVDPEEVFAVAEKWFGSIPSDPTYKRKTFYHSQDLIAKSLTTYRDVQQPVVLMGTLMPSAKNKKQYLIDVITWLLGAGESSRLTKKLVDELELVTEFEVFADYLEDATLFFMYFTPKDIRDTEKIMDIIYEEITKLSKSIPKKELLRATKKLKSAHISKLENYSKQVSFISEGYLFTGDENFLHNYLNYQTDDLEGEIKELLKTCFSSSTMAVGKVLPLKEVDKERAKQLQEISDQEDARILQGKTRETPVEPGKYADQVKVKPTKKFHFHKPEKTTLKNGLKVFAFNSLEFPKIELVLALKAKSDVDPQDKQGLYNFVADMLLEGTKNYRGKNLVDVLEEHGMSISISPGRISLSLLSEDFEKGLELLHEILTNAIFDKKAVEKIREKILMDLTMFWDEPKSFFGQLVSEEIYKGHPYSKNGYGTIESIKSITQADLINFYKEYFSPQGASIAVVGDIKDYETTNKLLEKHLGKWQGKIVEEVKYPALKEPFTDDGAQDRNYLINRDQVVLGFSRATIDRADADYDKLLLFDQIFGGGSSGSMNSKLFALREATGLFYTITGTLIAGADEQPGVFLVKTIVSRDRLEEAKKAIKHVIDTVIDTLTEEDLEHAKQIIINARISSFSSNKAMAGTFLAVDKFKLPEDYFDKREENINKISLVDVKEAAKKYMDSSKMITIQIGRVDV